MERGVFILFLKKLKIVFIYFLMFFYMRFFLGGGDERVRKGRYFLKFLDLCVYCVKDD